MGCKFFSWVRLCSQLRRECGAAALATAPALLPHLRGDAVPWAVVCHGLGRGVTGSLRGAGQSLST